MKNKQSFKAKMQYKVDVGVLDMGQTPDLVHT
jgi:hypothetical protein